MKKKCVIFDLDGTLLDTITDLQESVNVILEKYGLPQCTKEQAASYLGNGSRFYFEQACQGILKEELFETALQEYQSYYKIHMQDKTKPFAGIISLLETLRNDGIKIAVVSNKFDIAVKELCQKYFENGIDFVVGEGNGRRPKPYCDMLEETLKQMQVSCQECVYVGDSEIDIQTGKAANIDVISVTWGFRTKQQLIEAGASILVDTVAELYQKIKCL